MQEIGTGQGANLTLAAATIPVAEADPAVTVPVAGEDVGFPDYATIEVAAQIDERRLAVADAFAIDDPFPGQSARQGQPGLFHGGEQLAAKRFGQRLVVEEVPRFGAPAPGSDLQAGAGYGEMHMRIQVEPARVRVQHRHRTGVALELAVVRAERPHRRPGGGEERGSSAPGSPKRVSALRRP